MFSGFSLSAIVPNRLSWGVVWYASLFFAFIGAVIVVLTLLFARENITKNQQDRYILQFYVRQLELQSLETSIRGTKDLRKITEEQFAKANKEFLDAGTRLDELNVKLGVPPEKRLEPVAISTAGDEKIVEERSKLIARYPVLRYERELAQQRLTGANTELSRLIDELKKKREFKEKELAEMKPELVPVYSLIYIMFETRTGGLLFIPPEALTMLLTILMGAIGGFLHVVRVFLDNKDHRTWVWYLSRPFLGTITALAMFVLMKAGQLTFTSGGGDTLNPYFVAFLGIISGLLANDAYETLNRAGAALFRQVEPTRYAFGLAREMATQNVTPAALAAQLQVKPEIVDSWMTEAQPVPAEEQRQIAAFMKKPRRELFTDQAPP